MQRPAPRGANARNPDLSQIPQSQFQSSLSCHPLFLPTLPFAQKYKEKIECPPSLDGKKKTNMEFVVWPTTGITSQFTRAASAPSCHVPYAYLLVLLPNLATCKLTVVSSVVSRMLCYLSFGISFQKLKYPKASVHWTMWFFAPVR